MSDIEHFKQVNNSHGHVLGDEILLLVSRMLAIGSAGLAHVDPQYATPEINGRDGRKRSHCCELMHSDNALPVLRFVASELF